MEEKVVVKATDRAAAEGRAIVVDKRKPLKVGDAEVWEEVVQIE